MGPIKTYSDKNETRIVCPVLGAESRLADCFSLQNEVARGKQPPERRACQACMRSSKCPTYWIARSIQSSNEDPYWSPEPKLVQLQPKILAQVAPIIVRDDVMNALDLTGEERELLVAANERASSGAKAPRSRAPIKPVKLAPVKPSAGAEELDDVTRAAMSGDMAAAVSRATQSDPAPTPMTSFIETLSNEQKSAVLAYRGPENHGADELKLKPEPAPKPAPKPKAVKPAPAPAPEAPAGKPKSLLELARERAAQQAA